MAFPSPSPPPAVSSQLLLRNLDGRTTTLRFTTDTLTGSFLYDHISSLFRIPASSFFILTGTKLITPQTSLSSSADPISPQTNLSSSPPPHQDEVHTVFPSCNLLLRLRGGKGGFGSLLRGAATKAGQKKTSNFDACRDMSGRRLRHVNAEKKLKEWKEQSKERQLEMAANEYLKKQAKIEKEDSGCAKEIEKYREETFKSMEDVEDAVLTGLAEAKKFGKRKIVDDAVPSSSSKRAHMWYSNEDDIMEGSEDEDEDSEDGGKSGLSEDEHDKEASEENSAEEGSEKKNVEEGSEKKQAKKVSGNEGTEVRAEENVCGLEYSAAAENVNEKIIKEGLVTAPGNDEVTAQLVKKKIIKKGCRSVSEEEKTPKEAYTKQVVEMDSENIQIEEKKIVTQPDTQYGSGTDGVATNILASNGNSAQCQLNGESRTSANVDNGSLAELSFDCIHCASDLEVLGLEKLKQELQSRGLKCGGSLAERAGRLFLLKTITLDKLDKKHFAKSRFQ